MKFETRYFGEIEVPEGQVIHFNEGLPGFEKQKQFVLLNNYDTDDPVPFMWLQSIEDPDLAFVVSIPFFLKPDYEFELPNDVCSELGIQSQEQVGVYTICRIEGPVDNMTFNLSSPLIINAENKKATQLILNDGGYSTREFIK